ncbi:MAG: 2OG-Fe(II) oxygenase [Sulfurimonas sp.]|nr:2OG-Fe(II) oxygenase [Sulfurimonas sp.]MDD3834947.1 2OG-Fe(II) oxygenase [Sulfurimonas sp.]
MHQTIYSKITDALVDVGYIVIEDAISKNLSQRLLKDAIIENNFKPAGISDAKKIDTSRRRDRIHWLDDDGSVRSEFLAFTDGFKEYLNRTLFMVLTYYESHYSIYRKGDFYETHLDAFKNSKNRVVTTVYYLNREWQEGDGGELVIYNEDGSFLKKVEPRADTLVVFLSERFPHEVLPAIKKRYSIAGWFRVDKRV